MKKEKFPNPIYPSSDYDIIENTWDELSLRGEVNFISQYVYSNSNFYNKSEKIELNPTSGNFQFMNDNNGEISTHVNYHYNHKKNLVRLFSGKKLKTLHKYNVEGELNQSQLLNYREDDKLTTIETLDKDNQSINIEIYQYDKVGRLVNQFEKNSEYYKKMIIHKSQNLTYKLIYHEIEGNVEIFKAYKYEQDNLKNIFKQSLLDTNQKTRIHEIDKFAAKETTTRIFDFEGRILSEEAKRKNYWELINYQYNEKTIKRIINDKIKNETHSIVDFYNDNTKIICSQSFDHKGKLSNEHLREYIDDTWLSKRVNKSLHDEIHLYEYEFDRSNNWIARIDLVNGKLYEKVNRIIKYK